MHYALLPSQSKHASLPPPNPRPLSPLPSPRLLPSESHTDTQFTRYWAIPSYRSNSTGTCQYLLRMGKTRKNKVSILVNVAKHVHNAYYLYFSLCMCLFLINAITLRWLVNREWFWAISSVPSKRAVELLSPMRSACGVVRTFTGVHPVAETQGYLEQDERLWSQVFDLFHKERKSAHLIG